MGGHRRGSRYGTWISAVGLIAVVVGAVLVAFGTVVPSEAATQSAVTTHKITLCHRTASYTNPYVVVTVDIASAKFRGHDGHDGPVFTPAIPHGEKWGDIIPPFDFGPGARYPGKNWTNDGQAIWNNGCVVTPTTTSTTSTSTTSTTSTSTTTTSTTTTSTTSVPPTTTTTVKEEGGTTTLAPSSTTTIVSAEGSTVPTTVGKAGGAATTTPSTTVAAQTGSLPVTGSSGSALASLGLALMAGGTALLFARRRRVI